MSNISELFEEIEREVEILETEIKNKNWVEVWYCLHSTVLNVNGIKKIMSKRLRKKYNNLMKEISFIIRSTRKENEFDGLGDEILELKRLKS